MPRSIFRLSAFHRSSRLVSRASFPASVLGICLFPFALPWLTPAAVLPGDHFSFRLGAFPFPRLFFRPFGSGSCYSDSRFYLSLHPASPNGGSDRANLSTFRPPVSMLSSGFGTGHAASSFHRPDFRHTAANISALPFLSGGKFPIAFALGSGYLAGQCTLKTEH